MDLLYFVVLVSSLIFVHELGHFMFAKAFGVKVLTFSLGFGPKILRLRGQETEYCVGLLPLGGYVKMLEASKTDIVLPEDRHRTFESLAVYKRILIVLAGPAMNLLFPILLYFLVFVGEGPVSPPTIGVVLPGHTADGLLMPGDRVMSVNGQEIGTFDEMRRIIEKNPAKPILFKVFRNNHHVEVEVMAEETIRRLGPPELDILKRYGKVGIKPRAPAPVIGVSDKDSPAWRAGLRTFDVITHIAGKPVRRFMDLEAELSRNRGETVPVTYQRPVSVPNALGGLSRMAVYESGVVALTPDATRDDLESRTGIELADLYAAAVPTDSGLYKMGLRRGDRLVSLDGKAIPAWSTFDEWLQAGAGRELRLEYISAQDGRTKSGKFVTHKLSVKNWLPEAPEELVEYPSPIDHALTKAVEKTIDDSQFILVLFYRLLQGRLSLDSLSGPIAIYEVAGEEGRKGPAYFIWVMAVISINLGLLNLMPIPVLDGGHFMFFLAEAVMRRPLPLRVREVAHIFGMAIIVGLMTIAFKNDVEKRWDVIVAQVRELVS